MCTFGTSILLGIITLLVLVLCPFVEEEDVLYSTVQAAKVKVEKNTAAAALTTNSNSSIASTLLAEESSNRGVRTGSPSLVSSFVEEFGQEFLGPRGTAVPGSPRTAFPQDVPHVHSSSSQEGIPHDVHSR